MKKSLIALAALAVVGAASAQSSVTLYGRLDLGMSHNKVSNTNALTGVTTSGTNTSLAGAQGTRTGGRLGVRGTEDLGGGLKANFTIETNVNPDNNGTTFGATRQAHLSLVGGFGGVIIGTFLNGFDDVRGYSASTANVAGGDFLANNHGGGINTGVTGFGTTGLNGRSQNAIAYRAVVNGFNFGLGTTYEKAGTTKTRGYIGHIGYDNGPLSTKFAIGQAKAQAAAVAAVAAVPGNAGTAAALAVDGKVSDWGFAVSYDLGMAVPYFQYEQSKGTNVVAANTERKVRSYELGAKFPMGAFTPYITLSSGKATGSNLGVAIADSKTRGFQIGTTYDLSKRTYAYFALGQDKRTNMNIAPAGAAAVNGDRKNNGYALGLVHSF